MYLIRFNYFCYKNKKKSFLEHVLYQKILVSKKWKNRHFCQKKIRMFEAISSRRSCRSFDSNKPVPKDVVDNIVKTALNSPTGCDFQSYDFLVVTNKEKLNEVAQCVSDSLKEHEKFKVFVKSPEQIFYGAPLVIFIVPAREFREDCFQYDLGIIGNSICLAAQLQGLSSVQVGFVQHANPERLSKI